MLLQAVDSLHALREVHVELPIQAHAGKPVKAAQMQTMQDVLRQVLSKRLLACSEVTPNRVVVEL